VWWKIISAQTGKRKEKIKNDEKRQLNQNQSKKKKNSEHTKPEREFEGQAKREQVKKAPKGERPLTQLNELGENDDHQRRKKRKHGTRKMGRG